MIKKILVSQPKPSSEKSPYFDIAERYGVDTFHPGNSEHRRYPFPTSRRLCSHHAMPSTISSRLPRNYAIIFPRI